MTNPLYEGRTVQYEYELGTCWEHEITYIGRGPSLENKFVCIDGEGHAAAENVGEPYGWEELKRAYRVGHPDAEQRLKRRRYEGVCTHGSLMGLDGDRPWTWDQEKVNKRLARLPGFVWKHDRSADL